MMLLEWFRPGLNIKRWIIMGACGLSLFILGISKLLFRGLIFDAYSLLFFYISIIGIILMYASLKLAFKNAMMIITGEPVDKEKFSNKFFEQKMLVRGPKIVAIGGGTGLSTMLRGLKEYTTNITAIVTVADDGGGSGKLRRTLGMLPPGDIRNCLVALAHTEPLMEELMQYRFKDGELKGQSFGNLFIAAMNGISSNFEEAIKKMSDVLAVKGKVYPVTLTDVTLCARLKNGEVVKGESIIPEVCYEKRQQIDYIYLEPQDVKPLDEAIAAIEEADCIVIGPGSLYTSIMPNLVIKEVAEAVKKSKAIKVYISNIMTQLGETEGYKLSDHINAIEKHCGGQFINFVIANNGKIPEEYFKKYKSDGQDVVENDVENIRETIDIIFKNLVHINENGLLRHNTHVLAKTIMELIIKYVFPNDRRRVLDYYYLSERLKHKR
ncbi:gluconeogenesis factor YvcK family protein [Thermobrachium celere]|uniref:gluconeogenesis factor YvcK family protein n=1 Tax=Thermobrachium celere TaxID=53422 RepID=UPI001941AF10|nr:YvcK family protein [Thermobrachium celere]GFR34557.1 putative gluconeogenesis factor [Thermobrachium celere]